MKQYLIFGILLLIIGVFLFAIPLSVYDTYPLAISIIGMMCIIGVLSYAVKREIINSKLYVALFFCSIACTGLFMWKYYTDLKSEMKQFGVVTYSKPVIGRTLETSNYGTHHELSVSYTTPNNEALRKTLSIENFEDIYQDVDIPIVYSSRHPEIAVLLDNSKDVESYLGISPASLDWNGIVQIMRQNNQDSTTSYLHKLSPLWIQVKSNDNKGIWYYWKTKQILIKYDEMASLSMDNETRYNSIINELKSKGFEEKEISKGGEKALYVLTKDSVSIACEMSDQRVDLENMTPTPRLYYSLYTILIPVEVLSLYP